MDSTQEIHYLDSSDSSETENSNDEAQELTVTTPLVARVFADILSTRTPKEIPSFDDEQSKSKKSKHDNDNFFLFTSDGKTAYGRKIRNTKDGLHVTLFIKGEDTILGEIAEPNELFGIYECRDISAVKVSGQY